MNRFLIKRPNESDNSVVDTQVRKLAETPSDVKTIHKDNKNDRKCLGNFI